jgi:hypothetical protein
MQRVAIGKLGKGSGESAFQAVDVGFGTVSPPELGTIWHQRLRRPQRFLAKALKRMVGVTGIEPVTPTMSKSRPPSRQLDFRLTEKRGLFSENSELRVD